jgi:hypothetical protein
LRRTFPINEQHTRHGRKIPPSLNTTNFLMFENRTSSFNPLPRCHTSAPGGHKICSHAMSRNRSTIETSHVFFATSVRSCPFRRPRPTMLRPTEHHRPPGTETSSAKTKMHTTRATVIRPDRNPSYILVGNSDQVSCLLPDCHEPADSGLASIKLIT